MNNKGSMLKIYANSSSKLTAITKASANVYGPKNFYGYDFFIIVSCGVLGSFVGI
jgi:hypothetical protein